ncbi:hypothetical protein Tco_0120163 [Tanacetum coccineum]
MHSASTFWRRHGRDISSSSRYLFLDFQCPVSASSLFEESSEESSEDELTLLRRLRRLSSESELGGLSFGECLCPSLLMDIATAQPITDADAPVIVFISIQVLQVSRLSTQNFLSDSTEYWRSTVILSAPFLLVAR